MAKPKRYCVIDGCDPHNGRTIACGTFLNAADAEAAVVKKRLELHTHNDLDRAS